MSMILGSDDVEAMFVEWCMFVVAGRRKIHIPVMHFAKAINNA